MAVQNAPRYASLAEAASYARIHPKTLRRRIDAGELTGYRLGSRILRVDLDEVDAMLQPNAKTAEHISKLVDTFPPLTDEQRDRLAVLLNGTAA